MSKLRDRTCTGTNRAGARCGRTPAPGHLVCYQHGASQPDQLAAARRRVLEAADPAAARLVKLVESSDDPVVQLRAAVAILDRVGIGPSSVQVQVDGGRAKYQIDGVDLEQL